MAWRFGLWTRPSNKAWQQNLNASSSASVKTAGCHWAVEQLELQDSDGASKIQTFFFLQVVSAQMTKLLTSALQIERHDATEQVASCLWFCVCVSDMAKSARTQEPFQSSCSYLEACIECGFQWLSELDEAHEVMALCNANKTDAVQIRIRFCATVSAHVRHRETFASQGISREVRTIAVRLWAHVSTILGLGAADLGRSTLSQRWGGSNIILAETKEAVTKNASMHEWSWMYSTVTSPSSVKGIEDKHG